MRENIDKTIDNNEKEWKNEFFNVSDLTMTKAEYLMSRLVYLDKFCEKPIWLMVVRRMMARDFSCTLSSSLTFFCENSH